MAKKKTSKAAVAVEESVKSHILMVPLDRESWEAFTKYRAKRREARDFPWTVRDCMTVAVHDYLDKYANDQED